MDFLAKEFVTIMILSIFMTCYVGMTGQLQESGPREPVLTHDMSGEAV